MKIVYFGHDISDATLQKRIKAMNNSGVEVVSFTMRRSEPASVEWKNIDLGRTYDRNFFQRLFQIIKSQKKIHGESEYIESADVIFARNIDMLLVAILAIKRSKTKKKIVYECLDIHTLFLKKGGVGFFMRKLESVLLKYVFIFDCIFTGLCRRIL